MRKHLSIGDNHQKRYFIGAEISEKQFVDFSLHAKKLHRSRSGLIRYLIENADSILSQGDNHLQAQKDLK